MKTTEFTTTILKPEDGYYLTEKADVDILSRTIAKTIALGKNDNADNYIEIDEEECKKYKILKEYARKELEKAKANDVSTKN